jgi:Ca2+:H+ antiporter
VAVATTKPVAKTDTKEQTPTRRIIFLSIAAVVATPLGYISERESWGSGATFVLFALAVVPLAGLTSAFSDILGRSSGIQWLAKLLNVLFNNIVFILLGVISLYQGLTNVVKASIAGALISNTLFVLGLCFFLGNMRMKKQTFKAESALNYSKLLSIVVIGLAIPALVELSADIRPEVKNDYSGFVAALLLVNYLGYILFTVFGVFDPEKERGPGAVFRRFPQVRAQTSQASQSLLGGVLAFVALLVTLAVTVFASSELANVTQQITTGTPMRFGSYTLPEAITFSQSFVGLVIIPLIGSVAEHFNTIAIAVGKDRRANGMDGRASDEAAAQQSEVYTGENKSKEEYTIDEAIENTAGTALQIAMLAAPIFVLYSLFFIPGHVLGLYFDGIEVVVIALGTFLFYLVTEDGKGTWHEGLTLLTLYLIFVGAALLVVK